MQEGRQLGGSAKHFGCKGCGSLTWLFFWANGESTEFGARIHVLPKLSTKLFFIT